MNRITHDIQGETVTTPNSTETNWDEFITELKKLEIEESIDVEITGPLELTDLARIVFESNTPNKKITYTQQGNIFTFKCEIS